MSSEHTGPLYTEHWEVAPSLSDWELLAEHIAGLPDGTPLTIAFGDDRLLTSVTSYERLPELEIERYNDERLQVPDGAVLLDSEGIAGDVYIYHPASLKLSRPGHGTMETVADTAVPLEYVRPKERPWEDSDQ